MATDTGSSSSRIITKPESALQSFNSFKKAHKAADNVNVSLMKGEDQGCLTHFSIHSHSLGFGNPDSAALSVQRGLGTLSVGGESDL
jgi:hypothetical protein